ncbi:ornithine decarboxylase-like isoform X2 [Antennarius striatus]|uniref:ornithine decarboxylase-like isoform X2 n=1 Tax=Antennarius striatus TaxID=241820 RepID=UPI0035AF8A92
MSNMENQKSHAPLTTNASTMKDFSPEFCDIGILDNGKTIPDFIDDKINELGLKDSEEPFFVASLDSLYMKHVRWVTKLPRVTPFYAVKCNSTPAVLKMLRALGTGFDCASKGEIKLALSLGVTPDKIIYAHTIKPPSHIKYACTHGVNMMTFDSEDELQKISLNHAKAKLVLRIAVDDSKSLTRLNFKFGAGLETVAKLLERAKELSLEVIGVSFHVGNRCCDSLTFKQAIADARQAFDIANMMGFKLSVLDIGGGYFGREESLDKFNECSEVINAALEECFPPDSGVEVIAEPGRYYVESSFTLVMSITGKKVITDDVDEQDDVGKKCNKRMMYYMNDGVYGNLNASLDPNFKFEPHLKRAVKDSEQRYKTTVWGPTCDSMDKICDTCYLPELHIGDWLILNNMGAYSTSLSTDFNGFEKAHIYSVVAAELWHTLNLSQTSNNN